MLSVRHAPPHPDLLDIIRTVKRRWRMKVALRGLAVLLVGAAATLLVSTFAMDLFRFSSTAVLVFRVLAYGAVLGLAIVYVVRPLLRRVTDDQVALYLEEHEPTLQASLLGAVDLRHAGAESVAVSPAFTSKVIEDAIERCRRVEFGHHIEQPSIRRSSGTLAGLVMVGALVGLINPGFLRHAAPYLFPLGGGTPVNPYSVGVLPGDTLLARGADQVVTAQLVGFEAEVVEISVKRGEGEWERFPMIPTDQMAAFEIYLFDLDQPAEYYVEASGVRSPVYRIDVADLPYVQQIDLAYRFPRYTGLSPRVEENGGDVAALRGTNVTLTIQPTIAVGAGRLLVDGEEPQDLVVGEDGKLTGTIVVQRETYYRIELEGVGGRMVPASPDYSVYALDDQPPAVTISTPGRDTKVTNIEEAFVEVEAEDDYGLGALRLVYSVNGGEEDTIPLFGGGRSVKDLKAGHTFYLEEFGLEPGDLVAYYAQVTDRRGGTGHTATTDIYFMEVRPFRRDYRQADQGGMPGGGGGGGEMDGTLSVQQRQVVAATFKMVRDKDGYEEDEYNENLATLALSQGRIRERVEAIARRLTDRGIVQSDSGFRSVYEELPLAIEEMKKAEEQLGERDPDGALPPAQKALQHLQRADAAFRDVQVNQGQQGGGGGGGGQQAAEDLADLFELELDKLKNQYETVQRGQQEQVDQEIDATLQRLRELARRQQQENERMRQRAQRLQQGGQAGGGSARQQELADEAEEIARQLRRLAREQSLPDLEQTARELQQAADAMRRSAARSRNADPTNGVDALERLREARRMLEQNQSSRLERDVQDAMQRIEALQEDQDDMVDAAGSLPQDGAQRAQRLQQLREKKDEMATEIADLETRIDRMAREARGDQPEAARDLEGAVESIRDNRLSEKIRYSRGVIASPSREYAQNFEEQIGANLEDVRRRLEEAAGNIGEPEGARLGRSLDQTRELVQGLESMRERMQERAEQRAAEERGEGQQGQEGQAGQEGREGQQGQEGREGQQGQAGQQGQSGQQGQPGQGQQGQGDGRGAPTGNPNQQGGRGEGFAPGGGWDGRLTPGDVRQFRNELRQRRGDAERLRDDLRDQGIDVNDMANILERMRQLDRATNYNDPEEVRRLQDAIIEGLKEFEYALRRELLGGEEGGLTLSGNDDVPAGFRELVDQYYRELSKKREGGN